MSINSVFGILYQSGVPFLERQFGNKTLPFTLIASLGGLFTFTNSYDNAELSEFSQDDSLKVRFKLYDGIVLLVHVTNELHITNRYVRSAMDHLHLIIISEFGQKNLVNCQNADKLKSAISSTLNAITSNLFDEFNCTCLHLNSYAVAFINRETKSWSNRLEKFLDLVDTTYGCVFLGQSVYMLSSAWLKLPLMECINLLLSCSRVNMSPEKVIYKKSIYLPLSSPNNPFLLVCMNYHPFRVFSLCPVTLEDSDILSAFNRVFTQKERNILVKDEHSDTIKFDGAVLALTAMRNSESIVYVSEHCSDHKYAKKIMTYATARDLVAGDTFDENGNMGDVNSFFSVNRNMNCHIVGNGDTLISALIKPNISQILSEALILDIINYFSEKMKK